MILKIRVLLQNKNRFYTFRSAENPNARSRKTKLAMTEPTRRSFIRSASLAFGSVLLLPSCRQQPGGYRFFTAEEAACLIAFCEQIIPGDESPGATDAGVIWYIDRQLSGVFEYDRESYRNGLKNLQGLCTVQFGKNFGQLAFAEQTLLLKKMEANQLTAKEWPAGKPADFFNLVRSHTMQGFYGSPIHGGNRDYASFRMLRLDYPLVIGQNRYRS